MSLIVVEGIVDIYRNLRIVAGIGEFVASKCKYYFSFSRKA